MLEEISRRLDDYIEHGQGSFYVDPNLDQNDPVNRIQAKLERVFLRIYEEKMYDKKNFNSLIDNNLRVYKGGSWNDVAYWLSPGTRRSLDQDSSTATIGFRCAMIAIGPKGKRKL